VRRSEIEIGGRRSLIDSRQAKSTIVNPVVNSNRQSKSAIVNLNRQSAINTIGIPHSRIQQS
jgi:hypothetical protein